MIDFCARALDLWPSTLEEATKSQSQVWSPVAVERASVSQHSRGMFSRAAQSRVVIVLCQVVVPSAVAVAVAD